MPNKKWTATDLPSLAGKVALVTGANRGLGLEVTAGLAGAGATVVMACRDAGKAQAAAAEVRRRVPGAKLELMSLDLASLDSIRAFAKDFSGRHPRLDLLVNNASAIMVPLGKTRDGFETHIGTNHFGTYALTGLLLDALKAAPGSRVVSTSSMAHKMTKGMNLDDYNFERSPYKEMDAYGKSKLATLLFMFELDRRLKKAGTAVSAVAAHPGWSNTNPDQGGAVLRFLNGLIAQSAEKGALPTLYAAGAPGVSGGEYYGPGGFQQLGGYPAKVDCRPEAKDPALATRLWELSEKLTGVKYALAA
jgi:NAD(P)-dependent dehydrogenase (short-subunit alcohol dehydrogenase family)